MEAPPGFAADEVTQLRDCLNGLTSVMALPALSTAGEPAHIASTLLDALLETLQLGFVCVRLHDPEGGRPIEMVRVAESLQGTGADQSVASAFLGLRGEIGIIAAGSPRADFPTQSERLLLDVAANRATIGLQQARLLREREHDSRVIVDTIPGLVAILTPAGEVAVVNHELIEYCGQPLEAMKQWGTNGTVHSGDVPRIGQVFTQAITAGDPYDFEARIRRFDGLYRWCQVRGLPMRDLSGRIVRWYVLLTDIDERKSAEDALRASARSLKLIIDTIPALAWSARADGSAEFFNQHYLDFVGLTADRASGWGWTAAVHPEDLNQLAATWEGIMASGAPGEAEARLRRYDGEYRWFLFRTNPLRDEAGTIVSWYGVNTDIEDRKRAEAELRRAYDSFSDAQRLSKTGSFITDLVGDDHNWSDEAHRIFQFDPGSRISVQRVRDIIHPEDLPSFESVIVRGLTGENVTFAFRIVTARGAIKHVRGVAHVVERVAGRPLFVGALQDVTESKVAEEALDRARTELAHVARASRRAHVRGRRSQAAGHSWTIFLPSQAC